MASLNPHKFKDVLYFVLIIRMEVKEEINYKTFRFVKSDHLKYVFDLSDVIGKQPVSKIVLNDIDGESANVQQLNFRVFNLFDYPLSFASSKTYFNSVTITPRTDVFSAPLQISLLKWNAGNLVEVDNDTVLFVMVTIHTKL